MWEIVNLLIAPNTSFSVIAIIEKQLEALKWFIPSLLQLLLNFEVEINLALKALQI